jgi:glycosyltransferase involved in cell wall biosynthesis
MEQSELAPPGHATAGLRTVNQPRHLRIAQLAPLFVRIPPERYGGTERVVHALTEGLVRRGHKVTLFAAGSSQTSAELHATWPRPLWTAGLADQLAPQILQIEELVRRSRDFDVIHSHVDHLPWLAGERLQAPVVTTPHWRLDTPERMQLFGAYRGWPLVSISESQRRPVRDLRLNWVATVHHGLPLSTTYRLGAGDGGYLAFLGRMAPEKGPVTAIRVAIRAGLPIKLAARAGDFERPYFQAEVRPLLEHPLVEWVGQLDDRGKDELLGRAVALLMPIDWEEPFGLCFIEALACGAPVIARPRGAVPELVRSGEHGFLIETEDAMVEACQRIAELDRRACRRWALERFSVERMVGDYESVYQSVMDAAWRRLPEADMAG